MVVPSDLTSTLCVPLSNVSKTASSEGAVRCYRYEIEENNDAVIDYKTLTGASSSSATVSFGNASGNVKWHSVYYSHFGAFTPTELMPSDFSQDIHVRMALAIQHLQDSTKPYLKNTGKRCKYCVCLRHISR